jgi:hypothetical protein
LRSTLFTTIAEARTTAAAGAAQRSTPADAVASGAGTGA